MLSKQISTYIVMGKKKNVLVISGSPRRNGNSDLLSEAFIKGVKQTGHEVELFQAGRKQIKPCIACNKCYSKGTACVFKDDFNELAPMVEKAEVIVFATPLYWFSYTAQIKAAIDKIYSLMVGDRPLKIQKSILMVCGETDEMSDFDGIVRSHQLINNYLKWEDGGILLVREVNKAGDIMNTNALLRAEEMGRNI